LSAVLILLWVASCNGSSNTPVDAGTGDTDTDTDTDTDIDWGDTIPCVGEPGPGEVCVPGGKYVMGCVPGDVECDAEEGPMVEVTLSPFFVDVHEVTHDELIPWLNTLFDGYERLVYGIRSEEGPPYTVIWINGGAPVYKADGDGLYHWYITSDDLPTGVTGDNTCFHRYSYSAAGGLGWWGAKLYCEHQGKQLPTEAQWEAAARGQTLQEYPCGTDIEPCWWGTYDCDEYGDCPWEFCFNPCDIPWNVDSTGSGCWSPNGVADMLDNAHEWVLDWMDDGDDHSWCAGGCTDPEPREGARPILKGGGVTGFGIAGTRISSRRRLNDDTGNGGTGIRCVRSAVAPNDIPDLDGGS
jgi:formylglycine-generating enzyme required for sulfatase activity